MRKMIAAVLILLSLLGCAGALAASDEAVSAAMIAKSEEAIAGMREKATGWVKVMLDNLVIERTEVKDKSVNLYVTVPDLSNALTSEDAPDADYLTRALADYIGKSTRVELKLNATWSEKNGKITLKWSGNSNPTKLNSSLKNMAGKAKKTYTWKNFTAALEDYLLPKAVTLPKKKPDEAPVIRTNNSYGKLVAKALGTTSTMAGRRLPALMLLMDITKVDTTNPLEQTKLTIKVRDWQSMVKKLEKLAFEELENTVGAPLMDREEMDAVLCARLNEAMLTYAYKTDGRKTHTITVDLTAVVTEGVGAADGLMDIYRDYMKAMDEILDKMIAHAATLPFYPEMELQKGGVISGASHEGGRNVVFTMGEDATNHAAVAVLQDGQTVLTGFCAQLDRLMVQLNPGTYQVYFGKGADWCGLEYLFGEMGQYGMFELTVADEGQTRVKLAETAEGNAAVTAATWEEVRALIAPVKEEE